ncbi:hypothetical protein LAZ67_X001299 [Cordylochernes scorpioides]|uniref:Uncharacterized protein n=1 Tax=Cordylochernes scorpioides TaxID=51811 RepID=A0ABY6LUZ4_9ARAC|nr:hypothetical protein LAZ67_X001299 [Cordylochernes scorpioides]
MVYKRSRCWEKLKEEGKACNEPARRGSRKLPEGAEIAMPHTLVKLADHSRSDSLNITETYELKSNVTGPISILHLFNMSEVSLPKHLSQENIKE